MANPITRFFKRQRDTRRGAAWFPYDTTEAALSFKSVIDQYVASARPQATSTELTNLYATSPLVYTASNFRAANLAQVQFEVQDKETQTVQSHPLNEALTNASELIRRMELSFCFKGAALAAKEYNLSGSPINLRFLNFNLWTLDLDFRSGLKGFRIGRAPSQLDYDYVRRDQALYLAGVDFRNDFDGVGPAEVAFLHAGVDVEVGATLLALFQNMAIPAAIVQPAADSQFLSMKRDDQKLFEDILRSSVKGSHNAGKTILSPDRWEWVRMQVAFDEFAMPQIIQQAREAVFLAFEVPTELLFPSASGYAQALEARRAWLQTWLRPRAEWYAQQITEQVIAPMNPLWECRPNYERVAGMAEDEERLSTIVSNRVNSGTMTLADAQRKYGAEPDPNLEGLYMIQGVPVPSTAMPTYYLTAQAAAQQQIGGGGDPFGGMLPAPAQPKLLNPGQDRVPAFPAPTKHLPDDVAKELKDWRYLVDRKGVNYKFQGKALPESTVNLGLRLLSNAADVDDIDNAFSVIENHYHMAAKKKLSGL